jgi:hypothetical protein
MGNKGRISARKFREGLEEVVSDLGKKTLKMDPGKLETFCRLTGHDFEQWRERDEAPAGYLMTLTDPIVSEFFLGFFIRFPRTIKGVIYTTSTVEWLRPIRLSETEYRETLTLKSVEEKSGSKGDYFAVEFEVALTDGQGERVASDLHTFFLRV